MNESKYRQIRALVETTDARFVSLSFIKKNGDARRITVKPHYVRHIKGASAAPHCQQAAKTRRDNNPHLLNVWDVHAGAPKSINMATVFAVKVDGVEYAIH